MDSAPPPTTKAGTPALNRRWWTLVAVCGATFMLLVDVTIVQVALPTMQRTLHASFSDLQWVISAYALSLSALILTAGSLADRFGRKRVFLVGVVIFTLASLMCGLANSATLLIAARAVQGIGGAAMFATSLALIAQEFSGRERGTAIAVWGSTVGGAVAIGPLIGGALTSGLGWQWIFYVNVPVGALTLALGAAKMVNVGDPGSKHLDVVGLVTFSGALFLLILGLIRGEPDGWTSTKILSILVAAVVLLAIFVIAELRQQRPMFDLSLFRKRAFTGVSIATFGLGAGMFALFPYLTLYLQDALGLSPLQGGLRLLPLTVLTFAVPLSTRSVTERLAPGGVLGIGLVLSGLGLVLMHGITTTSNWTVLLAGLIVSGLGIGIANPAIAKIALGVVPPERSGMASGISNTFRLGGVATGVAALGVIFQERLASTLHSLLGKPVPGLAAVVSSGGPRAVSAITHNPIATRAALQAFVAGMNDLVDTGAVTVLIGGLAAMTFIRTKDLQAGGGGAQGADQHQVRPEAPSKAPVGGT